MYWHQDRLRDRGQVVWGHIIQANDALFGGGSGNWPALVVYSLDPALNARPEKLQEVGSRLFAMRERKAADRETRAFMAYIQNEMARPLHVPVPERLGFGAKLFMGSLYIHRKHLPEGYLAMGLLPLLVNPGETPTVMVVPSRYWSDVLVAIWESAGTRDEDADEDDE